MRLRDPEECPDCNAVRKFRVVSSRRRRGYRRKILRCRECGAKWPAFFTSIDPRRAWEAMSDAERQIYSSKHQ